MKKKRAFTLSEVLVTTMLIGVIAALTIPFFVQEFRKQRWTVTYKRVFAETFNALTRVAMSEDCDKSLICTRIFDGGQSDSTTVFGDKMAESLSLLKNCKRNMEDECFSHLVRVGLTGNSAPQSLRDTMTKDVNFEDAPGLESFYTFITNRGVSYALLSFGNNCLADSTPTNQAYINAYVANANDENNQMLNLCGFIIVDVNGKQDPNRWGRDVFGLWITNRSVIGVYPFGGDNDLRFHGKCPIAGKENQDSRGCAAQLIKEGWAMKY